MAAKEGVKEVVMLLLDQVADQQARIDIGMKVLGTAATNGNKELVVSLLDLAGSDYTQWIKLYGEAALFRAATNGNIDVIEVLLDRGVDVQSKDKVMLSVLCCIIVNDDCRQAIQRCFMLLRAASAIL